MREPHDRSKLGPLQAAAVCPENGAPGSHASRSSGSAERKRGAEGFEGLGC